MDLYLGNRFILSALFPYRGKTVYDPPRFMTVAEASSQILQAINTRNSDSQYESLQCMLLNYIIICNITPR